MIRFSAWSTLLGVLAFQILVLAGLLWRSPANRLAGRYLALVLVVIAGMLAPFVLGYAGAYDAWPWLTGAPLAVPLALGPLLYGHVSALVRGGAIRWTHFIPPALQFLSQALLFPFPVATKWRWDAAVHEPCLSPVLSLGLLVSMLAYAVMCWRNLRDYEAWLAGRRRDPRPARRVRLAVALLAILLTARASYDLFDLLVRRIDYFDLFAFYLLLATAGLLLGVDGWRNARAAAPAIAASPERDWHAQGSLWVARLRDEGWWRDPDLDLPSLARLLGTNTAHLSRSLNEGHGGLAAILSGMRAEAVASEIGRGTDDDFLSLALAAGFGSKASFNRAFRARFGESPRDYRARYRGSSVKTSALPDPVRRSSA